MKTLERGPRESTGQSRTMDKTRLTEITQGSRYHINAMEMSLWILSNEQCSEIHIDFKCLLRISSSEHVKKLSSMIVTTTSIIPEKNCEIPLIK